MAYLVIVCDWGLLGCGRVNVPVVCGCSNVCVLGCDGSWAGAPQVGTGLGAVGAVLDVAATAT